MPGGMCSERARGPRPGPKSITGAQTHENSVDTLLCPHLDLLQPLAFRAPVLLFRKNFSLVGRAGRNLLQRRETKALAPMRGTETGAIIVYDISEWYEARPVDVVDAVHEDERERDEHEREPEEEVIEQRVVCMWVESAQNAVSGC